MRPSRITGYNCPSFLPHGSLSPHPQAFSPSDLAGCCLNSGWTPDRLVLWKLRCLWLWGPAEKSTSTEPNWSEGRSITDHTRSKGYSE